MDFGFSGLEFDGISQSQSDALVKLDRYLREKCLGDVHFAIVAPVHAKASLFIESRSKHYSIVGSSNLSGIQKNIRQFELDVCSDDQKFCSDVKDAIGRVRDVGSKSLSESLNSINIYEPPNSLLSGLENVHRDSLGFSQDMLSSTTFQLPLKAEPKSNLNVFFGKGRQSHGYVIPRNWYEVELIVGVEVTRNNGYPLEGTSDATFDVITDDGWTFTCTVNGQNSKNFRSQGDLKVLGKWIKGRLQQSGSLTIGEPVTQAVLDHYGRNSIGFTKFKDESRWYLDFKRPTTR